MLDYVRLENEIIQDEGKEVNKDGLHILYFDHLGNPTICYGQLVSDKGGIPDHIARELLQWKIGEVVKRLDDNMPWWRGESDMRKRALINMAFQLGIGGLMKFKRMLWAMQHGNYETAYKEALDSRWAKQTPNRAMRVAKMIRDGYDS